ncbi:MAG: transketolase family protein [Candidatus Nitrohelix vancouverensis]|uniref:Transketolase family protein n=1 Tax=Candidatus Nitrohelix vancouverensis TaxID=2705534 RepID=A0A7T0C3J4_9BACT|nr:MAG: transketolase family protein [Candidatus Nitrohelix vancouverensis]
MIDGATRDGYGEALLELGEANQQVVVLDSGVSDSTRTKKFGDKYPNRFFNMGISEGDMVCTAAGLATTGKIPFATSFACFLLGRSMDQTLVSVAYSNTNVKLVGTHSGIAVGEDGPSAQMIVDMAYTRAIPNMVVIQPADWEEARQATKALAEYTGPAYLRLGRAKLKGIYDSSYKFEIGKASVVREGSDVVIFATGGMVQESLLAIEAIGGNPSVTLVNVASIKPLDEKMIIEQASKHKAVITAEDHNFIGGLGDAVGEVLLRNRIHKPVERIAVKDQFAETGSGAQLYEKYGLSSSHIVSALKSILD